MFLGHLTVSTLFHYIQGVCVGKARVDPTLAQAQADEIALFQTWLQDHHDEPGANWDRIVSVYAGPGSEGVLQCLSWWKEFSTTLRNPIAGGAPCS
jgi:hypothetical protein